MQNITYLDPESHGINFLIYLKPRDYSGKSNSLTYI